MLQNNTHFDDAIVEGAHTLYHEFLNEVDEALTAIRHKYLDKVQDKFNLSRDDSDLLMRLVDNAHKPINYGTEN